MRRRTPDQPAWDDGGKRMAAPASTPAGTAIEERRSESGAASVTGGSTVPPFNRATKPLNPATRALATSLRQHHPIDRKPPGTGEHEEDHDRQV
jgi:hypothetical protein